MAISNISYGVAVLGLFLYAISRINHFISERRFQKWALEQGAEPIPITPAKWPWNIDGLIRVVFSERLGLDLFDDIIVARLKLLRRNTTEATGVFGMRMVSTSEPRNLQTMLASNFNDFAVGERRQQQFGVLLGNSIFNVDGAPWARARALFRPQFSRDSINDLEETDRATQILIDVASSKKHSWTESVDLMPLFFRFTLDTATAFIFGETVDSQLASSSTAANGDSKLQSEHAKFAEAFSVSQVWLSTRIKLQALYRLCDGPGYRNAVRTVRRFTNQAVDKVLQNRSSINKFEEEKYSVVEELAKMTQDRTEMRDQLLALLLAGRESTAALLGWLFYLLATHPDVFQKLRTIVLESFGPAGSTTKLDLSTLKSCRYLQHVISETLRLYPPVPINSREAVRDTILPVGGGADGTKPVALRKGQIVSFIIYWMHRRPDIWGEDADEFKPERFEDRKLDWSFLPFSGGPRICIGQQYAIVEASYLIVRMLQNFDAIEWAGPPGRPKKGLGLTLFPADGIPVRLHSSS